jgi:hypothetical protein
MAIATAPPKLTLISSSTISSTAVQGSNGQKIGKINLMIIDKRLNDAAELNDHGWMDPIWEIRHRPDNVRS